MVAIETKHDGEPARTLQAVTSPTMDGDTPVASNAYTDQGCSGGICSNLTGKVPTIQHFTTSIFGTIARSIYGNCSEFT